MSKPINAEQLLIPYSGNYCLQYVPSVFFLETNVIAFSPLMLKPSNNYFNEVSRSHVALVSKRRLRALMDLYVLITNVIESLRPKRLFQRFEFLFCCNDSSDYCLQRTRIFIATHYFQSPNFGAFASAIYCL